MARKKSLGNSEILLIRPTLERLFKPARLFTVTCPSLFRIPRIAVLGLASRFPLAPGVLQNLFRLHTELASFGKPLASNGFDFINLLVIDLILSLLDQRVEILDGRGFDDVFDSIAHGLAFAIVNVRCEMSVIKITIIL